MLLPSFVVITHFQSSLLFLFTDHGLAQAQNVQGGGPLAALSVTFLSTVAVSSLDHIYA